MYDIKNLVDNIRNNTISETDAKKLLNPLNKIKKAEIIKYKKGTPGHIKLLNLFNKLLNIKLTDKTSGSQENEKVESRKEENEDEDEDCENENEYKDYENEYEDYDNENKNDDETIDQNETIKSLNDNLDKIIDKSKSFEDQTESLKKLEDLKGHLPYNEYDDKGLKSKYFKINSQTCQIILTKSYLNKYLVIHLAYKLINTTNKEEIQIIVKHIVKNKDKLFLKDEFGDWVIQAQQRSDLKYAIDLILDFNEDLV